MGVATKNRKKASVVYPYVYRVSRPLRTGERKANMSKNNKHLHQFLHQLSLHQVLTEGQWWAVSSDELWHLNFSKEIVPIKTNATYPKGAVGI